MAVAALIVLGVVDVGIAIYGDIQQSNAAQTEADQQQQADALQEQQEQQNIAQLTTNQAQDLASYQGQQALEEKNQSTAEQNAYTSANQQLQSSQEQLGAERSAAQSGASTLISNAAARGIKVGSGAVQSGEDTGKGDIVSNPDGSVSYARAAPNVYDSMSSPLMQLAAYERTANLQIGNEAENIVGASNLATGEIRSGTAEFEAQQAQNLATFTQKQAQVMAGANLGYDQSVAAFNQQESFTQTNLQTYDSSLWLSAFSSIVNEGSSLLGSLWNPRAQAPADQPYAYDLETYADYSGSSGNLNFGNYYSPGG